METLTFHLINLDVRKRWLQFIFLLLVLLVHIWCFILQLADVIKVLKSILISFCLKKFL